MKPKSSRSAKHSAVKARATFRGDEFHLQLLKLSIREGDRNAWNGWRKQNPQIVPDLRGVSLPGARLSWWNLSGARLDHANLARADLQNANLQSASLARTVLVWSVMRAAKAHGADFSGANLRDAHLSGADCREACFEEGYLSRADLSHADLRDARLAGANLSEANLTQTRFDGADLSEVELGNAVLDRTSLRGATLRGANVSGCFIRRVQTDAETEQSDLCIDVTVAWGRDGTVSVATAHADDLQIAQFQNIVDEPGAVGKLLAATSRRVVLILGRFKRQRKAVLRALAKALNARGKTAIIFDFPAPQQREISDTVRFIAGMSEFIVVDLTDPSSVPLELQATVPDLMVPVLPIIQPGQRAFAMFADLQQRYFWIQPTLQYRNAAELVQYVDDAVIERARQAAQLIQERRASLAEALSVREAAGKSPAKSR